jgi:hypothetical protein
MEVICALTHLTAINIGDHKIQPGNERDARINAQIIRK